MSFIFVFGVVGGLGITLKYLNTMSHNLDKSEEKVYAGTSALEGSLKSWESGFCL